MRFEVCKFVRTQELRNLTSQELACKDNNYLRFDNLQFTIFLQKGYKNGREAALCIPQNANLNPAVMLLNLGPNSDCSTLQGEYLTYTPSRL